MTPEREKSEANFSFVVKAEMKRLFFSAIPAALLLSSNLQASDFSLEFVSTFSGTPPAGSNVWSWMLFQDVAPGTVSLTISNSGLTANEFIGELDFNLRTNLNPTSLLFANVGGSGGFSLPSIATGLDFEKADGDGFYDIEFTFDTSAAGRFGAGEYVVYQISGIAGLTASDFAFLSAPASGGGAGPFFAAAHIQSIGGAGDSGWVSPGQVTAVPEPTSGWLLGAGLLSIVGRSVFRRK